MSILRVLSMLLLPLILLEVSLLAKGRGMGKYFAAFLPAVPLLLGCVIAWVENAILTLQPKWQVNRSVMIGVTFSMLIAGVGYQHAKSRIEWSTGNNAAYVVVQELDPERIYYSGIIWEFYYGGSDDAFPFSPEMHEAISAATGRDVLVMTHNGECSSEIPSIGGIESGPLWSRLRLIESVPAFDYNGAHEIDWTRPNLSVGLCHHVYTFRG